MCPIPLPTTAAVALTLALAAAVRPAAAQEPVLPPADSSAVLLVHVRADETGEPLPGARAVVEGTALAATADDAGVARLTRVPPGRQVIAVGRIGYRDQRLAVALRPALDQRVDVALVAEPVEVPAVEATAERLTPGEQMLTQFGFFDRQQRGRGTFITRDDLERHRPRTVSDAIRYLGRLRVARGVVRPPAWRRGNTLAPGGPCPQFILDGVTLHDFRADELNVHDVEAIEVYRSAAHAPADFVKHPNPDCAVIVIWTRR